jgi:Raf kinase inhibitor-like YbhB/YbcL family protein
MNDFHTVGYGGPTPPKDHTYRIIVYALDAPLDLQSGFTKEDFTRALEGHVLAEATFSGLYKR